jgi:AhpD family alkylhydroperoxidase
MAESSKSMVGDIGNTLKSLGEDSPDFAASFSKLIMEAKKDGSISPKVKELIAVGMALVLRCHYCIAIHTKDAIDAGVTKKELIEVANVAVMMGGGPVATYLRYLYDAIEEFGAK